MELDRSGTEPRSPEELGKLIDQLIAQHKREKFRLDRIALWAAGKANDIYQPSKTTYEFRQLRDQSRFNVLPLVETTVAQSLFIDGYRPTGASGRSPSDANLGPWNVWQANRMDARQASIWRPAIRYGWSYAVVTPGEPHPVITPHSPRSLTTIWNDSLIDEWPIAAMVIRRPLLADTAGKDPLEDVAIDKAARLTIYDRHFKYQVMISESGHWETEKEAHRHGLGVVPVVRFIDEEGQDDPDIVSTGKIEPLIEAQRQLNQISFNLAMALQYGAFRQRYVTGMTIEEDASGNPVEPFNVAVDKLLHAEDAGTKFGEFGQTDPSGYLDARDKVLGFITSVAQIPPHNLITGSGIANISAEALASLQYSHRSDILEHQQTLGEAAEQMFRLIGLASGDQALWEDMSARVHWRDRTPRSLAQTADALGKMATMLDIPPEALWDRIPDITDQELVEFKRLKDERDQSRVLELGSMFQEQQEIAGADPVDPPASA